jgi:hypothetical protein
MLAWFEEVEGLVDLRIFSASSSDSLVHVKWNLTDQRDGQCDTTAAGVFSKKGRHIKGDSS